MKRENLAFNVSRQPVFCFIEHEDQIECFCLDPIQVTAQARQTEPEEAARKVEIVAQVIKAGEQAQVVVQEGIFFIETQLLDGIDGQALQAGLTEGVLGTDVERDCMSEDL